jgi:TonB family protein
MRLPNLNVPVRARAQVRYQSQFRCGLEFVGLPAEQQEMIRYWVQRATQEPVPTPVPTEDQEIAPQTALVLAPMKRPAPIKTINASRSIRIGRRAFYTLIAGVLILIALGWWHWQRSWNELERLSRTTTRPQALATQTPYETQVPYETLPYATMEQRIVTGTKIDPIYPEAARLAGTQGVVVLDATIAQDGSVKRLLPVSGPDPLLEAAADAVRSWRFEPYLSNGKPVDVETTIAVEFRLN